MEKEGGVMAEDEEERAEAGEVEKKTYKCSDCDKNKCWCACSGAVSGGYGKAIS